MKAVPEAWIVCVFLSSSALVGSGCRTPEEHCEDARSDAVEAWREFARELRETPEVPIDHVLTRMNAEFERYDGECRAHYGIALDQDADMTGDQSVALVACRSNLPSAELGGGPSPLVVAAMANAVASGDIAAVAADLAELQWTWDRGQRRAGARRRAFDATREVVGSCQTH